MDKPARLFLVRHGETEWNTAKIFQGHIDSALTERGLQQGAELATRLAGEGISAVYSSDQGRSLRTADIVARRLGLTVEPRSELREIDCGDWTTRSYQDVQTLWPDHFADWKFRPHLHQMPNGESVADLQRRALRFLEKVQRRHAGQSVLAVSHHTVVRTIICHLLGWPLARMWDGPRQPNCAINLIELRDGRVELVETANIAHLSSVGTSTSTSV